MFESEGMKETALIVIFLTIMPFLMAVEVIITTIHGSWKFELPDAHECYVSQVVWENLSMFFPQRIQQGRGLTIIKKGNCTFHVRLSINSGNYYLADDGLYHCTFCEKSYQHPASAVGHSYIHPGHHLYCPLCESTFLNSFYFHNHLQGCQQRHNE